ncbi:MAG: urease accessory protein UreE [Deltaproteobacteria bacterium]|nr:urease accessory protein UreE [Deltaproteobacteria bacterium]
MQTNDNTLPSLHGPVQSTEAPLLHLTLPFDARKRSRQRVRFDEGGEAALVLPRGTVLRHGDLLALEGQGLVQVKAAPETVSTVFAESSLHLARVAYHLGNRHVPLQITDAWLRYQHDHVLDAMVIGLGALVHTEQAPFEPEGGAHGGGHHGHSHEHDEHHHHDHGHHH